MKTLKIDHIGIAVKDLKEAAEFYRNLGLEIESDETVDSQKVTVGFIPCGDSEIELLEATSPESPVAKFIEKNGEGIHHIALRVDDIEAAIEEMKAKGIRMIDEEPRYGAGGGRIAFVHPKPAKGVLLELVERK
ncbi:MAG: methylmalonyl-CoA epimerase [Eubacteriales bacterium]